MTATVLIVDGPRSAGKTTVINCVHERFVGDDQLNVYVHKTGRPAEDLWEGINQTLTDWYYASHDHVVLVDRFHLTELVYSTAYARVDDFDLWSKFLAFDARFRSFGPRIRYTVLMASPDEMRFRTATRPEPDKRELDMDPTMAWYLWTMAVSRSQIATMRMNATTVDSERCVEDMVQWIKRNGGKR